MTFPQARKNSHPNFWAGVRACFWAFIFVALAWHCDLSSAETTLDSKRKVRLPDRAPLKWENLTDGLQHIAGPKPNFNRAYKLSVVDLAPGQSVDFQVPAHEFIRVACCCEETISSEALQIWTSNGTGLFRKLNPAIATDGLSMVAAPDASGLSIGRIHRPASATTNLAVKIWPKIPVGT